MATDQTSRAKSKPAPSKDNPKPAPSEDGVGLKFIRVALTPKVRQQFRIAEAEENLPKALLARRQVREWLESRTAKRR